MKEEEGGREGEGEGEGEGGEIVAVNWSPPFEGPVCIPEGVVEVLLLFFDYFIYLFIYLFRFYLFIYLFI